MDQSVVVTGASSGLGQATAGELAAAGYHVIMACRSHDRGEAAAAAIRDASPGASLEVLALDLASLASVRTSAETLRTEAPRPPLHALVCNAGIQVIVGTRRSANDYELTFATNHLGHFLLTNLLLPALEPGGRILVVSSGTHFGGVRALGFPSPAWTDPRLQADAAAAELDPSPRAGRVRYANSKLANLYFTYELARRLDGTGITCNAFDPGLMPETGLSRDYPPRVQRLYTRLAPILTTLVPGARTVAAAANALRRLVTDPELDSVTGAYFAGYKRRRSSKESYDETRAADLWQASLELTA